ncbi:MAG TPA: hypothetical protein VFE24_03565 [Pirellulales bacterium]|jgi:hypothetical protein|nr:hypothetical protein [Pirellulales bacterium]
MAICGLILALALAEPAAPAYTVKLTNPAEDRVDTAITADSVTFTVKSHSGIGTGSIALAQGLWPKKVVLRFDNFPALEGFYVDNGRVRLDGGLGFGAASRDSYFDQGGKQGAKPVQAVYHLKMRRVKQPPCIEVELPANLLPAVDKPLSLQWIDAYR